MGRSKRAEGRERLRQEVFLFHDLLLPASCSRSALAGGQSRALTSTPCPLCWPTRLHGGGFVAARIYTLSIPSLPL